MKKTKAKAVKAPKTREVAVTKPAPIISLPEKLEQVLVSGNLVNLQPEERVQYYNAVCKSIRLNPLTKPFEYITLNGKLTLYARKDATDQLRKLWGVSVYDYRTETKDNVFIYTAFLQDASGRRDIGTGIVTIGGKHGDDLANAMMKAETKAKRRGTLSICGLGMLDESELETIAELPKVMKPAPIAEPQELPPPVEIGSDTDDYTLESVKDNCNTLSVEMRKSGFFTSDERRDYKDACQEFAGDKKALMSIYNGWDGKLKKRKNDPEAKKYE